MKTRTFPRSLIALACLTCLVHSAVNGAAQNSSSASVTSTASANPSPTPVPLSYGVPDILKLSKAKIPDDTVAAFIENSGTCYSLNASEIVYLREQGVSDRVLTLMLNQRQKLTAAVAQTTTMNAGASAPQYVQPATTSAQPTPTYAPASTVYVIPNSSAYTSSYYGYAPYYAGFYGYSYPAVSLGFGFGAGYYGGYYGGGYYPRGYYGGWGYNGGYYGRNYCATGYRGGGYWATPYRGNPQGGSYQTAAYAGGVRSAGYNSRGTTYASAPSGTYRGGGGSAGAYRGGGGGRH